jgi:hemerythrin
LRHIPQLWDFLYGGAGTRLRQVGAKSMWAAFVSGEDFPNLGQEALDDEHEQIARLMNELHDAVVQRRAVPDLRFLLHQLEVYVRINCRGEEQMMEHDDFPNRSAHQKAHEAFYRKLHDLEKVLLSKKGEGFIEELRTFRTILLHHVTQEDSRIANWHRVQSISPDSPD